MKKQNSIRHTLLAASVAVTVIACSPEIELRGNLPPPEQLQQVAIGKTTREEVQSLLGTPSSIAPFGDETWHYISNVTERTAFFEPEVKERKVITVVFDRNGIVRALDTKGLTDGKDVTPVDRETPTAGKELTILQQLMGNVGRFSKPSQGN
ncbi:outer membrane protein assembly factor BamE [Magnetospirillum sp. SS-4]|uniref:outer membrane protein assembly factor BamE n=1 Tax=Magnetospirillum sp. SS-4 TaxID=2681465 RepID=UPI001572698A|nr:outer membrane protein assembly factor BamE [Magnetospirillum sp. SS-4]